jgi:hypothetical protein
MWSRWNILKIWVEHLFHYYESGHTHTCVCVYYLMHNRTELAQANGGIIGARWPIRCPSKRLRVIRHILEYLFLLVFHIFRGHHARNIPHVVAILILSMMIITECINGHHRNNNKFPPPSHSKFLNGRPIFSHLWKIRWWKSISHLFNYCYSSIYILYMQMSGWPGSAIMIGSQKISGYHHISLYSLLKNYLCGISHFLNIDQDEM